MTKLSKHAAAKLNGYLGLLREQLIKDELETAGMSEKDKKVVLIRLGQLTYFQLATPGLRNTPNHYERLGQVLTDIGESEAAAILYQRAAAASLGHSKAKRYQAKAAYLHETKKAW